jgi:hypothetical protein
MRFSGTLDLRTKTATTIREAAGISAVEQVESAKTDATHERRIAKTVELMREGRTR